MKRYEIAGRIYQFDEDKAPSGAVLVDEKEGKPAQTKKTTPANKSRKTATK